MKNTLVITNRNNEEIEVHLNEKYPYCTFRLMHRRDKGKTEGLDNFIKERLRFHPDGRVHSETLYASWVRMYGVMCTRSEFKRAVSSALQERGAIKSVVSINGIKLQGYKGVGLK